MTDAMQGDSGATLQRYVEERFAREDQVLLDLRDELETRGFPLINVSPSTGRVLQLMVSLSGRGRVLEVGTLGGYSAIWMARGLPPGGRLTTLELDPGHAAMAREFLDRAGVGNRVEILLGDARERIADLGPDGAFDMVFLDADKEGYGLYAAHAGRLLRAGGLLLADNAFWGGKILEAPEDDATRSLQAFNDDLAASSVFEGTILPVGDGLAMGVKRS